MEKKNRKGLAVVGLLALCVILTVGLFMLGRSPKGEDSLQNMNGIAQNVTPNGIDRVPDTTPNDAPPSVRPGEIRQSEPSDGSGTGNTTELTVIPEKPQPPELPETAHKFEPQEEATLDDVAAFEALPAELRNPDVKPDTTPAPVQTVRQQDNAPQSGDRQNGQVYIPGFGWIKDEGGGGQGQQSVGTGSLDKIIGH